MASREQQIRNLRAELEGLRHRTAQLNNDIRENEARWYNTRLTDRERHAARDLAGRLRRELTDVRRQTEARARRLHELERER
jgi:hypothetical protein